MLLHGAELDSLDLDDGLDDYERARRYRRRPSGVTSAPAIQIASSIAR